MNEYYQDKDMIVSVSCVEYSPIGQSKLPKAADIGNSVGRKCDPFLLSANQHDAALPSLSLLEPPTQKDELAKEQWLLRPTFSNGKPVGEDELYWSGNSVAHSSGVSKEMRHVKKILSIEGNIQQSMWCRFYTYPDRPRIKDGPLQNENLGQALEGILIVGPETLHIHLDSGTEYVVRLQFPIVKVWQTKYGVLLERLKETSDMFGDQTDSQQLTKVPRFYSLLNPLNEIAPVISVQGSFGVYKKVNYLANEDKTVLFTSDEPSIAVIYDKEKGVHSIWKLRKTSEEEQVTVGQVLSTTVLSSIHPAESKLHTPSGRQMSLMTSHQFSPVHDSASHQRSIHSMQHHLHSYHSESPSLNRTPMRLQRFKDSPLGSRMESPSSEFSSLTQKNVSGSNSRLQSLRQGAGYFSPSRNASNLSPQAQIARSPIGSWNDPALVSGGVLTEEPIFPDLCLQFLWEEPKNPQFVSIPANKVFLSKDAVGQSFVCFLLSRQSVLCLLRYETLSNEEQGLIFKPQKYIPAMDAEPLTELNMILVLDPLSQGENSISLYSGNVKISRVVPPVPSPTAGFLPPPSPSQCSTLPLNARTPAVPRGLSIGDDTIEKKAGITSLDDSDMSMSFETPAVRGLQSLSLGPVREKMLLSTPGLSSSRRSSLAIVRHPSQLDESVNLLSPVGSITPVNRSLIDATYASPLLTNRIVDILDGVRNRATVRFSGGQMYRILLPNVSNHPLITKCWTTLSSVISKSDWDSLLQFLSKWYTIRNAPGSADLSPYDEWSQFSKLLFECIGIESASISMNDGSLTPEFELKRTRYAEGASNFDWDYLKSSSYAKTGGLAVLTKAGLRLEQIFGKPEPRRSSYRMNKTAVLSRHLEDLLLAFHLLYEELKLSMTWWPHLAQLVELCASVASIMGLKEYCDYYWLDFPKVSVSRSSDDNGYEVKRIPKNPPSVVGVLKCIMDGAVDKETASVFLKGFSERAGQIIVAYAMMFQQVDLLKDREIKCLSSDPFYSTLLYLTSCGWTKDQILDSPFGISLPLLNMLTYCHHKPQPDWPEEICSLIAREDLARIRSFQANNQLNQRDFGRIEKLLIDTLNPGKGGSQKGMKTQATKIEETGMETLENSSFQLRFPNDRRLDAVRRFLCSSRPVVVALTQRPEVSDHDFLEEQERHLFALCMRTKALPVGRGALTLQTCEVEELFDPLVIPRLCLSGKAPPRNTTVELTHIDVPSNMNQWPLFHNGVAAGLTLRKSTKGITDSWIGYNRPKATVDSFGEPTPEHAGFLFALGLLGHLPSLSKLNLHSYMVKNNDMLGVAVTLGMGISKKGTMDSSVLRMLAVCIEALTPATAIELNVPPSMTVSAFISLGWLYLGSGDTSMSEILLDEIGRPPGQESESCVERESHALSAGLGLGLVCLGKGKTINDVNDRGLADTLRYYMIGGRKRPLPDRLAEKYKSGSYQVYEGDLVNTDICGPGATLALGLMYLKSGNRTIADWMEIPTKIYSLESVRPDMLLLRVLARNLILWDEITPSVEWIENHVPVEFRSLCLKKPNSSMPSDIDYETINQAYCNIVPGACLAMAIRFAGSANAAAFNAIFAITKRFVTLSGKSVAELAGRATIETAINVMVLSLAMVMAGTGDIEILRLCRHLRSRVGFHGGASSASVTYGSHMAIHLALGLLFLGGGRMSLSTSDEAVAALVCAMYPKFPNHSNDNRYHLQALRHLYVLAAEPRLIVPRDLDSTSDCYVNMKVSLRNTKHYRDISFLLKAPCLLPELSTVDKVVVEDSNYWSVEFDRRKNWDNLIEVLEQGYLYVKRKVSGVSAPTKLSLLFGSQLPVWGVCPAMVQELSTHSVATGFCKNFLVEGVGKYFANRKLTNMEKEIIQVYTHVAYRCVNDEKLDLLPALLSLVKVAFDVKYWRPQVDGRLPLLMQQMSIVSSFANRQNGSGAKEIETLPAALVDTLFGIIDEGFSAESQRLVSSAKEVVRNGPLPPCEILAAYLSLHALGIADLTGTSRVEI